MIIIYISQRAEAIKPRQQSNYDAGIVLIDSHQLNVKNNFRQYNRSDTEYGQPHVNEEQNLQNNNPQHPLFLTKMIEQIHDRFWSKKGPEFLSLGHWSLPSETNVRKESIYIN